MATQPPTDPYAALLKTTLAAVLAAGQPVATQSEIISFYCVAGLLGVGLVLALVTIGVRQYRGLDRWIFRVSSGYLLPNSTLLWLVLDAIYLVGIQFFIWYPDHKIAVTSLVYIPLYLAAYSVSWGYAIAALTYSNTHSGARKSPPFYLSPIIVNTLCSILPIVFIIIITPLTLFADRDFTNGVDGIKEFVAVLTNASVNFNAGRPVDISSLPALQVQLMATFQKSKDWVRMTYISWTVNTVLVNAFFIVSAFVYFRLLRTSMNGVGDPRSRQSQAVRATYRSLLMITVVMITLGLSYLVVTILIVLGIQNIGSALYVLWSFATFGAAINVAILLRSLSQVSPSQTQSTSAAGRGTSSNARLDHLDATLTDSPTTKNTYDIELGSKQDSPPGVKVSQYE